MNVALNLEVFTELIETCPVNGDYSNDTFLKISFMSTHLCAYYWGNKATHSM